MTTFSANTAEIFRPGSMPYSPYQIQEHWRMLARTFPKSMTPFSSARTSHDSSSDNKTLPARSHGTTPSDVSIPPSTPKGPVLSSDQTLAQRGLHRTNARDLISKLDIPLAAADAYIRSLHVPQSGFSPQDISLRPSTTDTFALGTSAHDSRLDRSQEMITAIRAIQTTVRGLDDYCNDMVRTIRQFVAISTGILASPPTDSPTRLVPASTEQVSDVVDEHAVTSDDVAHLTEYDLRPHQPLHHVRPSTHCEYGAIGMPLPSRQSPTSLPRHEHAGDSSQAPHRSSHADGTPRPFEHGWHMPLPAVL